MPCGYAESHCESQRASTATHHLAHCPPRLPYALAWLTRVVGDAAAAPVYDLDDRVDWKQGLCGSSLCARRCDHSGASARGRANRHWFGRVAPAELSRGV